MSRTGPSEIIDTRQALLTAAIDLVQRVGYASFSFRDLAEAVGIKSASIHYHFPTKAHLGLALIEAFHNHARDSDQQLRESHPNARKRLHALADMIGEMSCGAGKSCPIHSMQAEFSILPKAVQDALRTLIDGQIAILTAWLDEGRKAGHLRFPGKPIAQARLVWSVIEYGSQLSRTDPEQSFTALIRQLIDTMAP